MTTNSKIKEAEAMDADLAKAEELAQKARQLRIEKCSAEISEVLKRNNCTFKPFFVIDGSQVKSYVNIVPVSGNSPPAQPMLLDGSR